MKRASSTVFTGGSVRRSALIGSTPDDAARGGREGEESGPGLSSRPGAFAFASPPRAFRHRQRAACVEARSFATSATPTAPALLFQPARTNVSTSAIWRSVRTPA